MTFFIGPSDDSDLQIQADDLAHRLSKEWPDIKIAQHTDQGYLVEWEIKIGDYWEPGGLQGDGQTITIQDRPAPAAKFAIWYRSQIPSRYRLSIYHDSWDAEFEFELLPTTTEEELLKVLNTN